MPCAPVGAVVGQHIQGRPQHYPFPHRLGVGLGLLVSGGPHLELKVLGLRVEFWAVSGSRAQVKMPWGE